VPWRLAGITLLEAAGATSKDRVFNVGTMEQIRIAIESEAVTVLRDLNKESRYQTSGESQGWGDFRGVECCWERRASCMTVPDTATATIPRPEDCWETGFSDNVYRWGAISACGPPSVWERGNDTTACPSNRYDIGPYAS
jgi:hypothetical protein